MRLLALLLLLRLEGGRGEECDQQGAFPDPEQCDRYWECRDGQLTSHLCPDGLVYDLTTSVASFQVGTGAPPSDGSRCSYPFAIDCHARPLLQPPRPSPNCPRKNGYFTVPGTCDQYWLCGADRPATLHTCPVSLVFAPDQGRCTWVGEAGRPECQQTDTFHQDFLCPESGFGEYLRYPDPADCRAYYVCVRGAATRSVCPAGQAFHPVAVACVLEPEVPEGLCLAGQLWEDRNATGSGAPAVVLPNTRTRTPVRTRVQAPFESLPATGAPEGREPVEAVDGRVGLDCVSCRVSGAQAIGRLGPVRLGDSAVLVGQQRAKEQTLFLDDEGKTTTTAIPIRLRTRTRIGASNGLRAAVGQEAVGGHRVRTGSGPVVATTPRTAAPTLRRRVRVRGGVARPRTPANSGEVTSVRVRGGVAKPRTASDIGEVTQASPSAATRRPLMRVQNDERDAVGHGGGRAQGRPRVRGSVSRPHLLEVEAARGPEEVLRT